MLVIDTINFQGIHVIYLHGILTSNTISEFDLFCETEIEKNPEIIALNFKDVNQIDSISLNHLFKLTKKTSKKNIRLIIYDPMKSIHQIFEVIKLDKVITILSKKKFEEDFLKFGNILS